MNSKLKAGMIPYYIDDNDTIKMRIMIRMSRLEQYILNETIRTQKYNKLRSEIISENEASDILHNSCKTALNDYKKGNILYRGVNGYDAYKLTDPSKGSKRLSAYAKGNFYTMFIENHKMWKGYPQRDVICTTDKDEGGRRSNDGPFIVFPYDGFKLGICPERDIWLSFKKTIGDIKVVKFNKTLASIYDAYKIPIPKDWNTMVKTLKSFTIKKLQERDIVRNKHYNNFKNVILSFDNIYDFGTKVLDPNTNGFKISTRIPNDKNKEVWTDSKCLLVKAYKRNNII